MLGFLIAVDLLNKDLVLHRLSVDFVLQLGDHLVDRRTVFQLLVVANRRLQDGRHLPNLADVVLLRGLCHHKAHAPDPRIRLVMLIHALRVLLVLPRLHHLQRGLVQLQAIRLHLIACVLLVAAHLVLIQELVRVAALSSVDATVVHSVGY